MDGVVNGCSRSPVQFGPLIPRHDLVCISQDAAGEPVVFGSSLTLWHFDFVSLAYLPDRRWGNAGHFSSDCFAYPQGRHFPQYRYALASEVGH